MWKACYCTKTVFPASAADQGQSPANKSVYPGGPGTKITSVSTGNLCADVSHHQMSADGTLMGNVTPE